MLETTGLILLILALVIGAFVTGRVTARTQRASPNPSRSDSGRLSSLEKEVKRADEIIEGMREGVLVLNDALTPVLANAAARKLLTLPRGQLPPRVPSDEVTSMARRALSERTAIESELNWSAAGIRLRAHARPLHDGDGVIMFLYDITDELHTQRLRRQFVANASHELKTPVASLKTLVDAVQGSVPDDPAAALRFSARLSTETDRLAALIEDLMDLSRVEDPAAMKIDEVDLSEIVKRGAKEFEGPAADARIVLEVSVPDGIRVRGDEQHLELLVRNLLANALRYTLEEGHVSVSLAPTGNRVILNVADDGVGIPLQAQARVFERFYRVDEDRARVSGGTGLGLAIVKNVAEAHGGTVSVTSELDEGSTFSVALPLAPGAAS